MLGLVIELLGEPRVRLDARSPVESGFDRAHLVLYYLAAHAGTPLRRAQLVELLWGGMAADAGRLNLRQTLYRLRRALRDPPQLELSRSTVCLHPDGVDIDLLAFEGVGAETEALEEVVNLYRGDFLDGLPLSGRLPDYEAWVLERRRQVRHRQLGFLERCARGREQRGDLSGALVHVRRYREFLEGSGASEVEMDRADRWIAELESGYLGSVDELPVTVVQFDVVWDRDPEEMQEILSTAVPAIQERLEACGAHVIPFPGGGVTAYFGYPVVRSYRVEEAVRAAREVIERGEPTLRAGIHAGTMTPVGAGGSPDLMGTVSATAFDLARDAAPGEIRISDAARAGMSG
jgi:hypothetical protein